jgi:hypothetical protein
VVQYLCDMNQDPGGCFDQRAPSLTQTWKVVEQSVCPAILLMFSTFHFVFENNTVDRLYQGVQAGNKPSDTCHPTHNVKVNEARSATNGQLSHVIEKSAHI